MVQYINQPLFLVSSYLAGAVHEFKVECNLCDLQVRYLPSGDVCRRLRLNPRVLGRITSNVWISVSVTCV